MTRKALGRGLEALIPKKDEPSSIETEEFAAGADSSAREVHVDRIRSNRLQPRLRFDEPALHELANSIRENGILQPLLVRSTEHGFELVVGERRLRAARSIGLETVPVIIRDDVNDEQSLRLALLENVQREDLNPIEEAKGYKRLIDEFRMSQQDIAEQLGKSRSAVANAVRLLSLPEDLRLRIERGELTPGHARALLSAGSLDEQIEIARLVRERGLNVRETEVLARRTTSKNAESRNPPTTPAVAELQKRLEARFGTRVRILARKADGSSGRIQIDYYSSEDLERVFELSGASYLL
jgi:ParB family chromosome partitioning protein